VLPKPNRAGFHPRLLNDSITTRKTGCMYHKNCKKGMLAVKGVEDIDSFQQMCLIRELFEPHTFSPLNSSNVEEHAADNGAFVSYYAAR